VELAPMYTIYAMFVYTARVDALLAGPAGGKVYT
jgi:hypothetical protein